MTAKTRYERLLELKAALTPEQLETLEMAIEDSYEDGRDAGRSWSSSGC